MARLKEKLTRNNVSGIVIDEVRVKQPLIPVEIKNLHIEIQAQKTAIEVANETKKVEIIKTQAEREKSLITALRNKEVALMQAEERRQVENVELARLEDIAKSELKRSKDRADMDATILEINAHAQAHANLLIHTPTFLRLHEIAAWGNSTKTIVYSDNEPLSFPLSALNL